MFDLILFLTKMLGGLGVPDITAQAIVWLKEKGVEYPDLKDRADALAAWLAQVVTDSATGLDPENMRATLLGIASDIVNGTAGVDPDAWQGSL